MTNHSAILYMAFQKQKSDFNGISIINISIIAWKFWLATYFQKVKEQKPSLRVPGTLN